MKKYWSILFFLFFANCSGYEPIFSSKDFKYSFDEIIIDENNNISKKLYRKLISFSSQNKEKIKLKIISKDNETVLSKDSKGDPLIFEIDIQVLIDVEFSNKEKRIFNFNEKFSFNNQTNKFELNQYKNTIKENLIDKVFDKFILQLRLI